VGIEGHRATADGLLIRLRPELRGVSGTSFMDRSQALFLLLSGALLAADPAPRKIKVNARVLGADELKRLEMVEKAYGFRLSERFEYWYDNGSGAIGLWQAPTAGFLPAGLQLGGTVPADASAGNTGVFINGRQLHAVDVMVLQTFMAVARGRWWVNGQGYFGVEGNPQPVGNVIALAQMAARRPGARQNGWSRHYDAGGYRSDIGGDSSFLYFTDSKGNSVFIDR
jgi:hypothetical protein